MRALGLKADFKRIFPGVLSLEEYDERRANWEKIRQVIGLDGLFYKGAESLLFPPEWIAHAEKVADRLLGRSRVCKAIGIDPAEGGDQTSMAAVDELGVIEIESRKTPDTDDIYEEAIAFVNRLHCPWEKVMIDRGGGGKQLADRLRKKGYMCQTVGFGEPINLDLRHGTDPLSIRKELREEKYAYFNRRAEMYGNLSQLMDPSLNEEGFGIPSRFKTLLHELGPIPKGYTNEGRLFILSKHPKTPNGPSLIQLIGHSPDEADATVLAVYGMQKKSRTIIAGAV